MSRTTQEIIDAVKAKREQAKVEAAGPVLSPETLALWMDAKQGERKSEASPCMIKHFIGHRWGGVDIDASGKVTMVAGGADPSDFTYSAEKP